MKSYAESLGLATSQSQWRGQMLTGCDMGADDQNHLNVVVQKLPLLMNLYYHYYFNYPYYSSTTIITISFGYSEYFVLYMYIYRLYMHLCMQGI